jgi:hypothetical protein
MGLQPFYGDEPHPLFWAGLWVARGKITVSGTPNCLNICEIFIVYAQFTNVATGRTIQPGGPHATCGPRVRDLLSKVYIWQCKTITVDCAPHQTPSRYTDSTKIT